MDFEYKMIIVMSSKKLLVYKQMKFVLKMIIGCHPKLRFFTHGLRRCVRELVRTQDMGHGESHLISWHVGFHLELAYSSLEC